MIAMLKNLKSFISESVKSASKTQKVTLMIAGGLLLITASLILIKSGNDLISEINSGQLAASLFSSEKSAETNPAGPPINKNTDTGWLRVLFGPALEGIVVDRIRPDTPYTFVPVNTCYDPDMIKKFPDTPQKVARENVCRQKLLDIKIKEEQVSIIENNIRGYEYRIRLLQLALSYANSLSADSKSVNVAFIPKGLIVPRYHTGAALGLKCASSGPPPLGILSLGRPNDKYAVTNMLDSSDSDFGRRAKAAVVAIRNYLEGGGGIPLITPLLRLLELYNTLTKLASNSLPVTFSEGESLSIVKEIIPNAVFMIQVTLSEGTDPNIISEDGPYQDVETTFEIGSPYYYRGNDPVPFESTTINSGIINADLPSEFTRVKGKVTNFINDRLAEMTKEINKNLRLRAQIRRQENEILRPLIEAQENPNDPKMAKNSCTGGPFHYFPVDSNHPSHSNN